MRAEARRWGIKMTINFQAEEIPKTRLAAQTIVNADGSVVSAQGSIVCEHSFIITVNEKAVAKLVCTPTHLAELVLGRLLTEGLISSCEDVQSICITKSGSTANVLLKERIAPGKPPNRLKKAIWKPEWIFELANVFAGDSRLHRETMGTHSCYLGVEGKCVFRSEDIGRHNAMDKCIGYAIRNGIDRNSCQLFTTGRVPTDMVQKAAAAGIPVLVSKAVPTDAGLAMAEEYNLTLICRAWPDSYVIFHEAQ